MGGYLRAVGAVIFLALAAYGMAAGTELTERPDTVRAEYVSVYRSAQAVGTVCRGEEYIFAALPLRFTVKDGERVYCGEPLAGKGRTAVCAPCAGFFSSDIDRRTAPEGAVGKLVYDLHWQFEADIRASDCRGVSGGDSVIIKAGCGDFPARVISLERGNGRAHIVLDCSSGIETVLCADTLSAELVFSEISGYQVPETAVSEDENGKYVSVLTGGLVKRASVTETAEYDGQYIVKGDISEGMRVIVGQR